MRVFIAVEIPDEIKKEIVRIQNSLLQFNGKKTEYDNLHLTLKFLGEISEDEVRKIKEKLSEIKFNKFEVEIKNLGVFSDRIIWLGIKNCDGLQREIDATLDKIGLEKERRFMGHLTIARARNVRDKEKFLEELKGIKMPRMKFIVSAFYLKQSILTTEKPVYKNLGIYSLN